MNLKRTGTTLHATRPDGTTVCGVEITEPLEPVTRDDLLCGKCLDELTDDIVFGPDTTQALERLLLIRLKAMPYRLYLKTAHWRRTRERALDHYGATCVMCDRTPVEVHHRTYNRRGEERLEDLIVLCREHHENFHNEAA